MSVELKQSFLCNICGLLFRGTRWHTSAGWWSHKEEAEGHGSRVHSWFSWCQSDRSRRCWHGEPSGALYLWHCWKEKQEKEWKGTHSYGFREEARNWPCTERSDSQGDRFKYLERKSSKLTAEGLDGCLGSCSWGCKDERDCTASGSSALVVHGVAGAWSITTSCWVRVEDMLFSPSSLAYLENPGMKRHHLWRGFGRVLRFHHWNLYRWRGSEFHLHRGKPSLARMAAAAAAAVWASNAYVWHQMVCLAVSSSMR